MNTTTIQQASDNAITNLTDSTSGLLEANLSSVIILCVVLVLVSLLYRLAQKW